VHAYYFTHICSTVMLNVFHMDMKKTMGRMDAYVDEAWFLP